MDNKRRSFRLDVEVGLQVRLISEQRLLSGIARLRHQPNWEAALPAAFEGVDEALLAMIDDLRRVAPKAAAAVELLNQKVDLIRMEQHVRTKVRELPIRQVNLSATGLAFDYTSHIDVGRAMHCTLTLPSIAWTLEVYARVVSSRPLEGDGYKVCLDFEFIRDEDREQLIRFNLHEQSRQLQVGE